MPFKKLFRSTPQQNDGLTQAAREAIVDLLHFCMYADRHLAVTEDEFIEAAARTLDWDARISYESYEAKSTGAVTRALGDAAGRAELLKSIKARLETKDRELALSLAEGLTKSDGTKSPAEVKALEEVRASLR